MTINQPDNTALGEVFTFDEMARIEHLVISAEKRGKKVLWAKFAAESRHSPKAVRIMAVRLRARRQYARIHKTLEGLRETRDAVPIRLFPAPPIKEVLKLKPIPIDHRIAISRLPLDAELRGRIQMQGATAGLMGDPVPGRSALDKKLAQVPA